MGWFNFTGTILNAHYFTINSLFGKLGQRVPVVSHYWVFGGWVCSVRREATPRLTPLKSSTHLTTLVHWLRHVVQPVQNLLLILSYTCRIWFLEQIASQKCCDHFSPCAFNRKVQSFVLSNFQKSNSRGLGLLPSSLLWTTKYFWTDCVNCVLNWTYLSHSIKHCLRKILLWSFQQ